MLGIGVMIKQLGGNSDSVDAYKSAVGKVISSVSVGTDDALHFAFTDGTKIKFFDDGQSCCESRYMRTDDDLARFKGATFVDAELRDSPTQTDQWGDEHEIQFLVVNTSAGAITVSNHNEHNGYYGGFALKVSAE
jgi:hypothetical protein